MIDTPTIALIIKWLSAYDVPYIKAATHIIKYHIKRKTTQVRFLTYNVRALTPHFSDGDLM